MAIKTNKMKDMEHNFKVGDKVRVKDAGLEMLKKLAPPGAKPIDEGVIGEFFEDEDEIMAEIIFPIGDDDPEVHSQAAPYPVKDLIKL